MSEQSDLLKQAIVQLRYTEQLLEECIGHCDKVITDCREVEEFVKKVSEGIKDIEESNGSWNYEAE